MEMSWRGVGVVFLYRAWVEVGLVEVGGNATAGIRVGKEE